MKVLKAICLAGLMLGLTGCETMLSTYYPSPPPPPGYYYYPAPAGYYYYPPSYCKAYKCYVSTVPPSYCQTHKCYYYYYR